MLTRIFKIQPMLLKLDAAYIRMHSFLKAIPGFPFFYNRKAFKLRNLSNGSIPNFSPFVYDLQSIIKGKLVTLSGRFFPIFPIEAFWRKTLVDRDVLQELHGFHWLSFFNRIGDHFYMKKARLITQQWIKENKDARSPAWSPKITATRLINWAQNYRFLISSLGNDDSSSIHRSFARQLSYLIGEEKCLLDSDDLICVIYAIIRLVPKTCRARLASKYIAHLCQSKILTVDHLRELSPDNIVENLQYLYNIKLLMQIWEVKNLSCLNEGISCCRQLLNNIIHSNGALATFNGKVPYPNEFVKTLAYSKAPVQTSEDISHESRVIKITSESSSILVDTGNFSLVASEIFYPLSFEYSCDRQVLISGAGVCMENRSFRGKDKALKNSTELTFKSMPVTHEMYEENKNTWFDGSARWLFMDEMFAITRQIYLCRSGQELRCEDRVSHAYGFATFLLFSIPESLKITKLKEVNGLVIEETSSKDKNQKWAWYFSKETNFQMCGGKKYPINGIMQAVKHIIVPCSRDYDHTVSRWSLRRL
ncbi:MAG: hypothetical protein LBI30_04030 [Holosporales bacterium]|jgi:hypothetical protein|nr:hypothetical protein [Holosporales bacterium]